MDKNLFLSTEHSNSPPLVNENITDIKRRTALQVPQGRVVGASLLCFCIDPVWSRLYFLLGKERKNIKWSSGSERWSDLGGKTNSKRETPEDTAAREFLEETLAMVRYFDHDTLPRKNYKDIADSLRSGEFIFQITIGFGTSINPCSYITFVKQIPWDPHAITRFESCRDMLLHPSRYYGGDEWNLLIRDNPCVKEIQTIINNTNNHHNTPPTHITSEINDEEKYGIEESIDGASSIYIEDLYDDIDNDDNIDTKDTKSNKIDDNNTDTTVEAEEKSEFNYNSNTPIQVFPGTQIRIKKEFMEKKMLGLWSIPHLRHAVEFNGIMSKRGGKYERCRPSFTTTIELVLSEFSFYEPETVQ